MSDTTIENNIMFRIYPDDMNPYKYIEYSTEKDVFIYIDEEENNEIEISYSEVESNADIPFNITKDELIQFKNDCLYWKDLI
jgi:hypothetical protein